MKRFSKFIAEKEEWSRIKSSDLPPVNKEYIAKKDAERKEAAAATAKMKPSKDAEVPDDYQLDMPQADKPDSYESDVRDIYRREASAAGSRMIKPKIVEPSKADKEIPQASKQLPQYNDSPAKRLAPSTLDTGIETGKFAPPDHPTKYKDPSLRTRQKM